MTNFWLNVGCILISLGVGAIALSRSIQTGRTWTAEFNLLTRQFRDAFEGRNQ